MQMGRVTRTLVVLKGRTSSIAVNWELSSPGSMGVECPAMRLPSVSNPFGVDMSSIRVLADSRPCGVKGLYLNSRCVPSMGYFRPKPRAELST